MVRELKEAMRELRRLRENPGRDSKAYKDHVAYLARLIAPCCRDLQSRTREGRSAGKAPRA